mmetsp:Transcript_101380/g.180220  ORF Transcript_101380/g.180220 Transcript_101380/m.180220 type:complete len:543 (-) Transcript_101380:58-1686(-)
MAILHFVRTVTDFMLFLLLHGEAARVEAPGADAAPTAVTLPFGTINGNAVGDGAEFLGVPYAKAQRFSKPEAWSGKYAGGVLDATKYSATCEQALGDRPSLAIFMGNHSVMSEDCLHLNVYVPAKPSSSKLPVLLWIHGGNFQRGSAMTPTYSGSNLAKHGAIVVAMNYRLGVFGWMAVKDADGKVVANNGHRDQLEAMRWVRSHIDAFGGDPEKVTLFGESSGGDAVLNHIYHPESAEFFQSGISQSAPVNQVFSLEDALQITKSVATEMGCSDESDLACLSGADAQKLLKAFNSKVFQMPTVLDFETIPAHPFDLVERGEFSHKPLIIGYTSEDAGFMRPIGSPNISAKKLKCMLNARFGEDAPKFIDAYAPLEGGDNQYLMIDILTDMLFRCTDRKVAQEMAKHGAPVWSYSFKRVSPCLHVPAVGAAHLGELMYVFDNVDYYEKHGRLADCTSSFDQQLAARLSQLWTDFASNRFPLQGWPEFGEAENTLQIDIGTLERLEVGPVQNRAQCDMMMPLVEKEKAKGNMAFFMAMNTCQN